MANLLTAKAHFHNPKHTLYKRVKKKRCQKSKILQKVTKKKSENQEKRKA